MHLKPIEYIGATPKAQKKPKRILRAFFLLAIIASLSTGGYFFTNTLQAKQKEIDSFTSFSDYPVETSDATKNLLDTAFSRTETSVAYDPNYYEISYPNGDLPDEKGAAADLIIRSFRAIGIDLQKEVHEDLLSNFQRYPHLLEHTQPDSNIDHRKVDILNTYLSLNAKSKLISSNPNDYELGDIVVWKLPHGALHIGIIAPMKKDSPVPAVIHNIGSGPKWENRLFSYEIIGHYRYGLD